MLQHADLPMDYADASLVALAEELDTNLVLTTDRRSFGRYRLYGRKSFRMLPSASMAIELPAGQRS